MPRRFLPEPHGLRRCCARRGWSGSGPGTVPVLATELAEFDACGTQSLCWVPAIGAMTCLPSPCEICSVGLRHLARRCALPQEREALLLPVIIGRADDCRPRDGGHFELLCSCSRGKAKESNGKTQERDLSRVGHASGDGVGPLWRCKRTWADEASLQTKLQTNYSAQHGTRDHKLGWRGQK